MVLVVLVVLVVLEVGGTLVVVVVLVVLVVVVGAGGRPRITSGTGRGTPNIPATVWIIGSTKRTAPGSMTVHRGVLQMCPPMSSRTVT